MKERNLDLVLWFFSIFREQVTIFFVFVSRGWGKKKGEERRLRRSSPFFATPWTRKTKRNGHLFPKNWKQTKETSQDFVLSFISIDKKWKKIMFLHFYRFSIENKSHLPAHMTRWWYLPLAKINKNEKNKNKINKNEKNEKFPCSFGQVSDFFFAWKSIKM